MRCCAQTFGLNVSAPLFRRSLSAQVFASQNPCLDWQNFANSRNVMCNGAKIFCKKMERFDKGLTKISFVIEAFPKLQFLGDKLCLSSNLEIRSFARLLQG
jgi:hypothetical protein